MILRKKELLLLLQLSLLVLAQAEEADTNDWIPITKPCATCGNEKVEETVVVEKKATGRVLNLNDPPQSNFFPEDKKHSRQQNFQQFLRETTVPQKQQRPVVRQHEKPGHPYRFEPPQALKAEPPKFQQQQQQFFIPQEFLNHQPASQQQEYIKPQDYIRQQEQIRLASQTEVVRQPQRVEYIRQPPQIDYTQQPIKPELTRQQINQEFIRQPVQEELIRQPLIQEFRQPIHQELRQPIAQELRQPIQQEYVVQPIQQDFTRQPAQQDFIRQPPKYERQPEKVKPSTKHEPLRHSAQKSHHKHQERFRQDQQPLRLHLQQEFVKQPVQQEFMRQPIKYRPPVQQDFIRLPEQPEYVRQPQQPELKQQEIATNIRPQQDFIQQIGPPKFTQHKQSDNIKQPQLVQQVIADLGPQQFNVPQQLIQQIQYVPQQPEPVQAQQAPQHLQYVQQNPDYHTIPQEYLNQQGLIQASNFKFPENLPEIPDLPPIHLNSTSHRQQHTHIKSTTPRNEKENVQLVYVPLENLGLNQNNNHQQIQNIQNDFIKQALDAHNLQMQLQQEQPYIPKYERPTTTTTTTTTIKPTIKKRKPHQPPLAVYMGADKNVDVADVLLMLRDAQSIDVRDSVGPDAPKIFVGPSNLNAPDGYVKFELPYLSMLDNNRVERKVDQYPFFVAPLSYKAPNGYSKIPLPSPHVGSVVVSTKHKVPETTPAVQTYSEYQPYTLTQQQPSQEYHNNFDLHEINGFIPQYNVEINEDKQHLTSQEQYIKEVVPEENFKYEDTSQKTRNTKVTPAAPEQYHQEIYTQQPVNYNQYYEAVTQQPNISEDYEQFTRARTTPAPTRSQRTRPTRPRDDTVHHRQTFRQRQTTPSPSYDVQPATRARSRTTTTTTTTTEEAPNYENHQYILEEYTAQKQPTPEHQPSQDYSLRGKPAREQGDSQEYTSRLKPTREHEESQEYTSRGTPAREQQETQEYNLEKKPTREEQETQEYITSTRKPAREHQEYHSQRQHAQRHPSYESQEYVQRQPVQEHQEYNGSPTPVYYGNEGQTEHRHILNQELMDSAILKASGTPVEQQYQYYDEKAPEQYDIEHTKEVKTQNANVENYNLPHLISPANQILPNLINNLEDHAIRGLFQVGLAPTSTVRGNIENYEISTGGPPYIPEASTLPPTTTTTTTTTEAPITYETTTVKRTRGRQRGNKYTTSTAPSTASSGRRNILQRGRRPVNVVRETTTANYPSTTEAQRNIPTSRPRFRTRGRPVQAETQITERTSTTQNNELVYLNYEPKNKIYTSHANEEATNRNDIDGTTQNIRLRPRITTTYENAQTTTASQSEEFYGFFREPNFKKEEPEPAEPSKKPVYSSTYLSSSLNDNINSATPTVKFAGEIRPKYFSSSTAQYFEVTEPSVSYYSSTEAKEEVPKIRGRTRVRLPGRREEDRSTSAAPRIRTRGKVNYRATSKPKQSAEDEDVEGGNYPPAFKATSRPSFQITVDPHDNDQVPHSSIYRPSYLNQILEDTKSTTEEPTEAPEVSSEETRNERLENENVDILKVDDEGVTTVIPEVSSQASRRRGVWKLRRRPVDYLEGAESQNYANVKTNLFDEDVKAGFSGFKDLSIGYNEKASVKEVSSSYDDKVEISTDLPEEVTTTVGGATEKGFFNSLYEMFGMNSEQVAEAKKNEENVEPANTTSTDFYDEQDSFREELNKFKEVLNNDSLFKKDDNENPKDATTSINAMVDELPVTTEEFKYEDITTSSPEKFEDQATTTTPVPMTFVTPMSYETWIKTSTSTEISHETEICYKGRCVKSKDMSLS